MVQPMLDNFSECRFVNCETVMATGGKQQPISASKSAVCDPPSETKNTILHSPCSLPLLKDNAAVADTVKASNAQKEQPSYVASSPRPQPLGSNAVNGHLVYVRRKLDTDSGKINNNNSATRKYEPESRIRKTNDTNSDSPPVKKSRHDIMGELKEPVSVQDASDSPLKVPMDVPAAILSTASSLSNEKCIIKGLVPVSNCSGDSITLPGHPRTQRASPSISVHTEQATPTRIPFQAESQRPRNQQSEQAQGACASVHIPKIVPAVTPSGSTPSRCNTHSGSIPKNVPRNQQYELPRGPSAFPIQIPKCMPAVMNTPSSSNTTSESIRMNASRNQQSELAQGLSASPLQVPKSMPAVMHKLSGSTPSSSNTISGSIPKNVPRNQQSELARGSSTSPIQMPKSVSAVNLNMPTGSTPSGSIWKCINGLPEPASNCFRAPAGFLANPKTQMAPSAISVQTEAPTVPTHIPIQSEPENSRDHYWKVRFSQLQMYLKACDLLEHEEYLNKLRALSGSEMSRYAYDLERRAIQLTLEEGKELHRVRVLNVLNKVLPDRHASVPVQISSPHIRPPMEVVPEEQYRGKLQ